MRNLTLWLTLTFLMGVVAMYTARNLGGEVAVLYTTDVNGRTFQTNLWVVQDGADLWIRSTAPTKPWLDRLINNPEVELLRGSMLKNYRATPLTHRRQLVNGHMARTYGWAEWLLAMVEDRNEAVPVYLDPFG